MLPRGGELTGLRSGTGVLLQSAVGDREVHAEEEIQIKFGREARPSSPVYQTTEDPPTQLLNPELGSEAQG